MSVDNTEPGRHQMIDFLANEWRNVPPLKHAAAEMKAILADPINYALSVPGEVHLRTGLINAYEIAYYYPIPEERVPLRKDFFQVSFTLNVDHNGVPTGVFGHDLAVLQVPEESVSDSLIDPGLRGVDYYPVIFSRGNLLAKSETIPDAKKLKEVQDMLRLVTAVTDPKAYQVSGRTTTRTKGIVKKRPTKRT